MFRGCPLTRASIVFTCCSCDGVVFVIPDEHLAFGIPSVLTMELNVFHFRPITVHCASRP